VSISEGACIMEKVNQLLAERFNIGHSTLQLECDQCGDGHCVFHPNEHGGKHRNHYANRDKNPRPDGLAEV
jgi:hypothetical protein